MFNSMRKLITCENLLVYSSNPDNIAPCDMTKPPPPAISNSTKQDKDTNISISSPFSYSWTMFRSLQ